MKDVTKALIWAAAGIVVCAGLYAYRTLELGRGDAQPAFLEHLNPGGELLGPEGICFDAHGNLVVADATGHLWNLGQGGSASPFASLLPEDSSGPSRLKRAEGRATGLAPGNGGKLYVTFRDSSGSSLTEIDVAGRRRELSRSFGIAGALITTHDGSGLWIADCRSEGRVLHYNLSASPPLQPDRVISGLSHPDGLALGKNDQILFVVEKYKGTIAEIGLGTGVPQIKRIADLAGSYCLGSLKCMAFDPRDPQRRFLYVAENLRGLITVLDVNSQPARIVKRIRLTVMGGRLCPGGIIIRDGYLYFTDIWTCNPLRLALGIPKWQSHTYRFRITDLASLY